LVGALDVGPPCLEQVQPCPRNTGWLWSGQLRADLL